MKSHLKFLLILILGISFSLSAQITLSHNIGNEIVGTDISSCSWGDIYWARAFNLQDFGIEQGNDFIITQGEISVNYESTAWNSKIQFNIYAIDEGFPETFNEQFLLGSSQIEDVWASTGPFYTLAFEEPVTVPANVERILVEVHQLSSSNSESHLFCSGTAEDNDISWFKSYCTVSSYTDTVELDHPNARFYITVSGNQSVMDVSEFSVNQISVYPNPVKDILYLETNINLKKYKFFNLYGQVVLEGDLGYSQETLSITGVSKGIYMLELLTDQGEIINKKIIKE